MLCYGLAWLLMLCFAKGTAKGPAKGIANALLWSGLLWLLASGSGCLLYTNLFVRYLIVVSKYHAEPPTLTRLGASADFLSTQLTITYKYTKLHKHLMYY